MGVNSPSGEKCPEGDCCREMVNVWVEGRDECLEIVLEMSKNEFFLMIYELLLYTCTIFKNWPLYFGDCLMFDFNIYIN